MRLKLISVLALSIAVTVITAAASADTTSPHIISAVTPTTTKLDTLDRSSLTLAASNECSVQCDLDDGPCLLKCMDDNDKKCLASCSYDSNFYPCVNACVGKAFPGSQGEANMDILQPDRRSLCFDNAICYNTCGSRSSKYCKAYCNYEYYWNCQHACGIDCPSFIERTSTTLIRKIASIAAPQRFVSTSVTTDTVSPTRDHTLSPCADRCDPGDRQCLKNIIDTCSDQLINFCKLECGSPNNDCVMDCVEGLYAVTLPVPDSAWSPPLTPVECFVGANGAGTKDHGHLTTYTAISGDHGHLTTYTAIPTVLADRTSTAGTGDHGVLPTLTAVPTITAAPKDTDRIFCMTFCCGQASEHLEDLEECFLKCIFLRNYLEHNG